MDTVSHGSVLVFWLPGLETARRLTRRKLFVVSVRSCHHTRGTRLTSPPILSTIIQRSILLSWRSPAEEPVPVPVVGSSSTQATLLAILTRSQPLPKTSSHHKELVNAVGHFISKDLLPLSAVEGAGFRSLMELTEPCFAVPSRKYFSQAVIPSLYLQERKKVETSLAQVEYCSFATDLWTAKYQNRSYISVSCHFIDQEWELHSYCLETRELPVDHTAQSIATELSQLLKDWNLRGSTTETGKNIY